MQRLLSRFLVTCFGDVDALSLANSIEEYCGRKVYEGFILWFLRIRCVLCILLRKYFHVSKR